MKLKALAMALALTLAALPAARAAAPDVVIGSIDDVSGVYADVGGAGSIEAMKMAIADFGGTVLGRKIVVLSADHQNKPDIGASKFREWADQDGLNMLIAGSNTGVSIAMAKVAAAKKVVFFAVGAGGASLTNEDCTPYSIHYVYDTTALANGTASVMIKGGGKSWFYLTADYAFGTQLQNAASKVVEANGGKNLGAVRVPLGASDFSSFLLQAQGSGAQVLGLANAGTDFTNSLKAANEYGITRTMKPAGLLVFITNIHSLGLQVAQGLYLTTGWYWDANDETRAFAKRFSDRAGHPPTFTQAGVYSAMHHYLNAVKALNSKDPDKVMEKMRETPINDFMTKNGKLRIDGRVIRDFYLFEVKKPSESKGPWDYYKLIQTVPGDQAFRPLDKGDCPLVKKG